MGVPVEKIIDGWQEFLTSRRSGGLSENGRANAWTMGTLAFRMIAGSSCKYQCERANANALRRDLRNLAQSVASIPVKPITDPKTHQPWRVNEANAVALELLIRTILEGYTPDINLALSYLHSQLAKIANTRPGRFKSDRAISDLAYREFVDSETAIFDFLEDVLMVNDPMYQALANQIWNCLMDSPIGVDYAQITIHRAGEFNNYRPELKFHINYHGVYEGSLDIRTGRFKWQLPAQRIFLSDVCPDTPPDWTQLVLSAIRTGYQKTGMLCTSVMS